MRTHFFLSLSLSLQLDPRAQFHLWTARVRNCGSRSNPFGGQVTNGLEPQLSDGEAGDLGEGNREWRRAGKRSPKRPWRDECGVSPRSLDGCKIFLHCRTKAQFIRIITRGISRARKGHRGWWLRLPELQLGVKPRGMGGGEKRRDTFLGLKREFFQNWVTNASSEKVFIRITNFFPHPSSSSLFPSHFISWISRTYCVGEGGMWGGIYEDGEKKMSDAGIYI